MNETQDEYQKTKANGNRQVVYSTADYRHFQIKLLMRVSMLLCIIMLFGTVILSLALMQVASLVRVDSVVLTRQNSSDKMVDVDPIATDMNYAGIVNEVMLKQYIILRHSIVSDAALMRHRWTPGGEIYFMSSPRVYNEFYYKNLSEIQRKLQGITNKYEPPVEIEFVDIQKIAGNDNTNNNLWSVDFDTVTYLQATGQTKRQRWNASLRTRNFDWARIYRNSFINPLGFVVTEYHLAQKVVK